MISWWHDQLFSNWKKFEIGYISLLLALQVGVYLLAPDSWIGMFSGIFGTLCLIYGMKGRKVSFIFGFFQCLAMTYVAWISHAYGSFAMDIFYVISQPIGWFLWEKSSLTKSLPKKQRQLLFGFALLAWGIGWWLLSLLHGQLPYFDSINFVVSFIAQILYICKFQENWSLWIVVNLANIIYWGILAYQLLVDATNIGTFGAALSQVALQAALLFNSLYATKVWASGEADYEGGTSKQN